MTVCRDDGFDGERLLSLVYKTVGTVSVTIYQDGVFCVPLIDLPA